MPQAEESLVAPDGARLWTRRWEPDGRVRASLVLLHGLGEHAGRYDHVARRLTGAGYAVFAFDLRGHGRSSGRRGDTRFSPTLGDVVRRLDGAGARHPDVPRFLYGHSLGALIALTALLRLRPPLCGAVLSAPPLRSALREQRLKVRLARMLGPLFPSLTVRAGLDPTALSRDANVVAAYVADPLVHDRASLGFACDSLAATDAAATATRLDVPLLIVHGSADRIAFVDGSRALAARLAGDVTLREYPGLLHEPHNEPERAQVLADVLGWLDARLF